MKTMTLSVSLALAATQLTAARPLMIDGTVCRMNRAVDRLIIGSDAGSRVRIAVGHSVPIRMNAHNYDQRISGREIACTSPPIAAVRASWRAAST